MNNLKSLNSKLNKVLLIVGSILVTVVFLAWLGTPKKISQYKEGSLERQFEEYLDKSIGIEPDKIRILTFANRPDIPGQRITLKFKKENSTNKYMILYSYLSLSKKLVENPPPFEIAYLNVWSVIDGTSSDGLPKEVQEGNFTIDYPLLKENVHKIDDPENFEKFLNARGSIFVRDYSVKDK